MGISIYLCCLEHKVKLHVRQSSRPLFDLDAVDAFLKVHEQCTLMHANDMTDSVYQNGGPWVGDWKEVEGKELTDINDRPPPPKPRFPAISIEEHDRIHRLNLPTTSPAQDAIEQSPVNPEPSPSELKGFWLWLDNKQSKGELHADERHWLERRGELEEPPKWLVERFRRETEQ